MSLPQCHAAFSTIPSTLAWVDQSPLASMCRSNPHQSIPSTTVTASHVTQGRVKYESVIPRGMGGGLDLWEAVSTMSRTETPAHCRFWRTILLTSFSTSLLTSFPCTLPLVFVTGIIPMTYHVSADIIPVSHHQSAYCGSTDLISLCLITRLLEIPLVPFQ